MKKKLGAILLVVALVLALALPAAPAAAHLEGAPQVQTLFAGQNMDVGDVEVWNDGTNLHVTYVITDLDWVITETHLYVGKTDPDTLTTAPGQFPYDDDNASGVPDTMVTYVIPLTGIYSYEMQTNKQGKLTGKMIAGDNAGVVPCNDVYIAAHAVVERTETGTFMPELAWERSTEPASTFVSGYGASWTTAVAFGIPLDLNQTVWDNGAYYNNLVPPGREWASWKYAYTEPDGGSYAGYSDLRRFQATFNVPDGYTVTAGSLYAPHFTSGIPINDNVYIFINGEDNLLFWGGTRVYTGEIGPDFLGITGTAAARGGSEPKETDRWYIPGTIPSVTSFITGTNKIDIFTEENERWGGMGKLVLELDYEEVFSETAWGDGTDFEHPNWATYFEYHVQGGIGEAGDEWTDVASDYDWEARARHGGAGGWRAFVDAVFPPVNPLWTGGTVPWLNGGQMWFELIYDDSTSSATFTIYRSSDDFVLGTVSDSSIPGFDGLIGIQGKTSPEAAGSVVVDNVKVNGVGLYGDDGFTAQGTDFVRGLAYLEISAVPSGSFTLTGDLTFTWGANPKDEGPALSIYVQN